MLHAANKHRPLSPTGQPTVCRRGRKTVSRRSSTAMVQNSQENRLQTVALGHSLAPLTCWLASLTHFAHSLARETVNDWMAILSVIFSIFDHSARVKSLSVPGLQFPRSSSRRRRLSRRKRPSARPSSRESSPDCRRCFERWKHFGRQKQSPQKTPSQTRHAERPRRGV